MAVSVHRGAENADVTVGTVGFLSHFARKMGQKAPSDCVKMQMGLWGRGFAVTFCLQNVTESPVPICHVCIFTQSAVPICHVGVFSTPVN